MQDVANAVTLEVDGEDYTLLTSYTAGTPLPAPAWKWPVTMTWDADGMETLAVEGWRGQLLAVYIPLLPAAIMFAFLGMLFFVWTEGQE